MAKQTDWNTSAFTTELFADLPVSPGATTSRVVVNNPLLRVVAFSMDEGQELTEHSSPRAVVVQVLEGKMTFTVAGETQELTAGDVVYLAPDDKHSLVARSACRFTLVMVDTGAAGKPA